MSVVALPSSPVGERERLSATLVLSLLLHGMLLLGLGFALEDAAPVLPTLDVMLTQTTTPLTPSSWIRLPIVNDGNAIVAASSTTNASAAVNASRPSARRRFACTRFDRPAVRCAPQRTARAAK